MTTPDKKEFPRLMEPILILSCTFPDPQRTRPCCPCPWRPPAAWTPGSPTPAARWSPAAPRRPTTGRLPRPRRRPMTSPSPCSAAPRRRGGRRRRSWPSAWRTAGTMRMTKSPTNRQGILKDYHILNTYHFFLANLFLFFLVLAQVIFVLEESLKNEFNC